MTAERVERRLAAVLAADVAGYSRLMSIDEEGTLAELKAVRRTIVDPTIAGHRGRIVKTTGDGMLVEFASVVDAVRCAVEVQRGVAVRNTEVPHEGRLEFRIGIHIGDIIVDDNDIFGDGVNIAARLEAIAEPGGICVSDDAYRQVRGKVEIAVDDMGPQALKNIAEPVRAWRMQTDGARGTSRLSVSSQPALPNKPSIAVMPFQNMSGDSEQEYFADGMVEDIVTALSRFKSLFVIARNSSLTYKGKAVDLRNVGRELGVRYVLEGSVRKANGRMRITGQLIDTATGIHLWADRFDGALEDVFELQDKIATNVAGAIAPKIEQAEIERAKRKPVERLEAYDLYLRGVSRMQVSNKEALHLFYRAIELDPDFATPYGLAARCYAFRSVLQRIVDRESEIAEARQLAKRVAEIGQDDAVALTWAGLSLFEICREYESGEALIDQALSINSNLAVGWTNRGVVSHYLGQYVAAIEEISQALRLSPLDPEAYRGEFITASAYLGQGDYVEGLNWARRSYAHRPGASNLVLISALALSGNIDDARRLATETCRIMPALSISSLRQTIPMRRPEDLDRSCEIWRLAGLPE